MSAKRLNKESILLLLEAASEMGERQREVFFDRVIDRVLNVGSGGNYQESEGKTYKPQLVTDGGVADVAAKVFGDSDAEEVRPRGMVKGSTRAHSVTGETFGGAADVNQNKLPPSLAGSDMIKKRGRGRPRKSESEKATQVVSLPEGLKCLNLLEAFNITNPRQRKILEEIAKAAREGGGRGIPSTENPDNYRPERRGGPKPVERVFVIDDQIHNVEPPIIARGGKETRGETNSIWIEFEKHLLGIDDIKSPKSEINTRQTEIGYNEGLKTVGIATWVEGLLSDGSSGVPTINAETARQILRDNPDFLKTVGAKLITNAPASWVSEGGEWNERLSAYLRDVWYGKAGLGRIGKFAMARLLMEPLGSIERRLMEIAFPEKYEDKEATERNLEARSDDFGRRKSSKKNEKTKSSIAKKIDVPQGEKKKRGRPRKLVS